MLQLRQFHLELALEAAGALREDVENQTVAVEHAPLDQLLEIALLAGRQGVVDQNDIRRVGVRRHRATSSALPLPMK